MAKKTGRRSKGRTGCRTCRIRKVKCDEARPVCQRCSSTGRVCDGYEMLATALYDPANRNRRVLLPKGSSPISALPTASIPASVENSLQLTTVEAQNFAYFRDHTTREIPGCFPSSFWDHLVLQLAYQEPAVLHAAVGVGAMHRTARGKSPSLQVASLIGTYHAFSLGQYVKAIGHLQSRLKENCNTAEIALVACLLFVCLEMLQGNRMGALAHLRNGLKVLSGMPTQSRRVHGHDCSYLLVKQERNAVVEQLAGIFARLDVDSTYFGERAPVFLMDSPQDGEVTELVLPPTFQSIAEARYFLDRLNNTAHHIRGRLLELSSRSCADQKLDWAVRYCMEYAGIRRIDPSQDLNLFARLKELQTRLTLWLAAFQNLSIREGIARDSRNSRAVMLLEIRHFYVFFQALTYHNDKEMFCDQFNSMFERIVSLSSTFIDGISTSEETNPSETSGLSFTLDSGAIPSLYLIAMKCRESSIRRKAISLLHRFPCQEGMWEGTMIAKFVENIANLEEAGTAASAAGQGMITAIRCEDVPEAARFSDVVLAATEEANQGILVCARFLYETTGELAIKEHLIVL